MMTAARARKKIVRQPPPELLAEYEKARYWATHFDEAQPGNRTVWHDIRDRLEIAIGKYNMEEKE